MAVNPTPWQEIRKAYCGGISYRALEAQYGIPKSTLYRRAVAEGWKRDEPPKPKPKSKPSGPAQRCLEAVTEQLLQAAEETLGSRSEPVSTKELKELTALVRELVSLRQLVESQTPQDNCVHVVLDDELRSWSE